MLLRFTVENFMSFKEKAILDLEPTNDKEHPENIIKKDLYKGLNLIASVGANSAGKTNLYRAITFALIMVRHSNTRQVNEPLFCVPFKFSMPCLSKPSKFEFQFIAADKKKYVYGFSADSLRIHSEYLYRYSSRKPTKIFERKSDETYEFTAREKYALEPLTHRNTNNKFFIATATEWNSQSTKIPFEWLANGIDTYSDLGALTDDAIIGYQGDESSKYIKFTESLMKEIDINISKLDVKIKKIPIEADNQLPVPNLVINGQMIRPKERTSLEIKTVHEVKEGKGRNKKSYELMLQEESKGTQMLFWFSPVLKRALELGKTLVIDEIEQSIHPSVIKYIVNLFKNKAMNPKGAQLIMTTHCTNLLQLEIFRRDQIYLVKKDKDTAESTIYSLAELQVRKGENIENGYLRGRYGAIPNIEGNNFFEFNGDG